jgi:threonine dehydrogenase-like Zn-dependent dehydrogenase
MGPSAQDLRPCRARTARADDGHEGRPRRGADRFVADASWPGEELWIRNVTITTGLVDTYSTATLLRLAQGHQIDPGPFVTHRFGLGQFDEAYDVFSSAADTGALKVVLTRT